MRFGENINYLWKMKKLILITLLFCSAFNIKAQNLILNGSFEDNIITTCYMEEYPNYWNDLVSNLTSFGFRIANINDSCITCPPYFWGGGAQQGHWFIDMLARRYTLPNGNVWGISQFSMDLDSVLKSTTNYKLSFYIKEPPPPPGSICSYVGNTSITVGISNSATNPGTVIFQSVIGDSVWTKYSVIFSTNNAEAYITVQADSSNIVNHDTYHNTIFVDNFALEETTEPLTTWHCLNNSCVDTADGSGVYTSFSDCQANCGVSAVNEAPQQKKKLIKIVDILGRESKPNKKGLLFYIYSDGTVEKKLIVE